MRHIKRFNQVITESLKGKLGFLEGKPITLIKTLHTVDKWNEKDQAMGMKTTDEEVSGFIGQIGDYEGYDTPGFWLVDERGKNKGFVMWDHNTKEFIDGDSSYKYTYQGKTDKDNRILQLMLDNLS